MIPLIATHVHTKRGTEYASLGIARMQAEHWRDISKRDATAFYGRSVDMTEVVVYQALDDGSMWVRPRAEFEDGRFEALPVRPLLGPIAPIPRDGLDEALALLDDVEKALQGLPYKAAIRAIADLNDAREHLHEAYPGGLAGRCEYCGERIGGDEIGAQDHENGGYACKACVALDPGHFEKPANAPEDKAAASAVEGYGEE